MTTMTVVKKNTNTNNPRNNRKKIFRLAPQRLLLVLSHRYVLLILLSALSQAFIVQPVFAITFTEEPTLARPAAKAGLQSSASTTLPSAELTNITLANSSTSSPSINSEMQQNVQHSSQAELENPAVTEILPIIAEEQEVVKNKKLRKPKRERKTAYKKSKSKQEQIPDPIPATILVSEVEPEKYLTPGSDALELTVEAFPTNDKLLQSSDKRDSSKRFDEPSNSRDVEPDYSAEPTDNNAEQNVLLIKKDPQKIEQNVLPAWPEKSTEKNSSSALTTGPRENFVNEFENFVATKIAPNVPGLALAIIADGKVKVLQGYGKKRIGGHDLVNANTVFRLASVSKTIASTAAAVLVRDGKINWDTTINSLIPEVRFSNPRYGDKITVRDIMSQATGLPTHTYTHLIEDNIPYADAVNRLRHVNFVCPPGKCYAYQNVTFSLISNITLKKTGTVFEKYVNEKIFKPLGMSSASFGLAGLQATNNFAQPHIMNRSRWMTTSIDENYYHIYPAAGANASITDMSRWVLAQMGHNPDVLSSDLLNQLHKKVTRNTAAQSHYGANIGATDTHYGLGWRIFDYRGDKNFVHHGGWVKGFRSEVVFNQELQIGMVLLTNSETKLARNIIFKFLDAYANDKAELRKVAQVNKNPKAEVGY